MNAEDDSGPLTPISTGFRSVDPRVVFRELLRVSEHRTFDRGQQRSHDFRRAVKDEGSGSEPIQTCAYTNETAVEAFSPIVSVLYDVRTECEFDSLAEGVGSYTLISDLEVVELKADDDSVLFADHFHFNRTYALEVWSVCNSLLCEDFVIFLNVTVLDYSGRLLSYGPKLEDGSLLGVDDGFTTLTALQPIPIFGSHYSHIYVSRGDHA